MAHPTPIHYAVKIEYFPANTWNLKASNHIITQARHRPCTEYLILQRYFRLLRSSYTFLIEIFEGHPNQRRHGDYGWISCLQSKAVLLFIRLYLCNRCTILGLMFLFFYFSAQESVSLSRGRECCGYINNFIVSTQCCDQYKPRHISGYNLHHITPRRVEAVSG